MSGALSVRPAGPAEADVLVALHASAFEKPWPRHVLAPSLAMPGSFAYLGTVLDTEPAAFVLCRVHAGEGEVMTLAVAPDLRRKGLARALMAVAIAEALRRGAAEMFLEVAADNDAALGLYRSLGFADVGGRRGYYARASGSVDAIVMRRALTPAGS